MGASGIIGQFTYNYGICIQRTKLVFIRFGPLIVKTTHESIEIKQFTKNRDTSNVSEFILSLYFQLFIKNNGHVHHLFDD